MAISYVVFKLSRIFERGAESAPPSGARVKVVGCAADETPVSEGLDVVGGVVCRLCRLLFFNAEFSQHSLGKLKNHAARMRFSEKSGDQDVQSEVEIGVHVLCCYCRVVGSSELVFPHVSSDSDVSFNLQKKNRSLLHFQSFGGGGCGRAESQLKGRIYVHLDQITNPSLLRSFFKPMTSFLTEIISRLRFY